MSNRGLFALRAPLPKKTALVLGLVMPTLVLAVWCVLSYGGLAPAERIGLSRRELEAYFYGNAAALVAAADAASSKPKAS